MTHDNGAYVKLARDTYKVLDRLYIEALNGVVCTPPDTSSSPWDDGPPTGRAVDVDAPLNRTWCGSCQSIWREIFRLRAECGAALGYAEFRDDHAR